MISLNPLEILQLDKADTKAKKDEKDGEKVGII